MSRRPSFVLRLARRELRSGVRRLGVYMASVTLGVAALVSIHAFRSDVSRAVRDRAEVLMGADARLSADRRLPDSVEAVLDSVRAEGGRTARVVTAPSMVLAPASDAVRLLQVRGVEAGYPFHGAVRTEPPGLWGRYPRSGEALVDAAVLVQLEVEVGDTLAVGDARLRIAGTVDDLPTDLGFQSAVGPRVWVTADEMADAGLLGFGSLARHETFLALPEREDGERLEDRYRGLFRATGVRYETAQEQARDLTRAVDYLGRYLGLVGLGALLLGGIGVASAVHVFVKQRLTGVAVLRCLGARQWPVFTAYLLQAAVLGTGGALVGAAAGLGVQRLLPALLADVLPVEVTPGVAWLPALGGVAVGVWVAVIFALEPLLAVRNVPPLRALRRDVEEDGRGWDRWRVGALAALGVSVVGLSVLEAPDASAGVGFALGLAGAAAGLWTAGWGLARATRRWFPRRARFTLRQGVANLFRPQNQTVSLILALGFGVFVLGTILHVEASLTRELAFDVESGSPNVLLFDIQRDQIDGVLGLLPPGASSSATVDPIVPARIAAVGGRRVEELRSDTVGPRVSRWALRREYRNTWRPGMTGSEELVAGTWWAGADGRPAGSLPRISVEQELAEDLRVGVGDRITWAVGGVEIETEVASLRTVDWERFETNFFVVFEPGVLDEVPASFVVLTRIEAEGDRQAFLRSLVRAHPNVSALDVTRIQEAFEEILGTVDRAVGFLAGFTALAGFLVLAGSLATSRYQRMREGALLKTLGARRKQVLGILMAEYLALGAMAALVGTGLATAAAAGLVVGLFEVRYTPALGPVFLVAAGVTGLTVVVGLLGSQGMLRRAPLPVLRELAE